MLSGLVPNLISGLLFFLLGFAVPSIRLIHRNSIQKKIFKIHQSKSDEPCNVVIYTSNPGIEQDDELCDYVYSQEYIAVGNIVERFKKIYKKEVNLVYHMTPRTIQEIADVDLCKNLILIGGPVDNCISRYILKEDKIMPYFEFKDHTLIYKKGNHNWDSLSFQGGEEFFEKDYALVINIKNPKEPSNRIIMSCGCRSLGTLGGVEYLCNAKDPIPFEEYALIISCHGNKECLTDIPKAVKIVDISKVRLTIKSQA